MMAEERLAELTVDIKAHGLRKRIEIWRDPTGLRQQFIIDGRNRLEACKRAGIEPEYRDVTGDVDGDPIAYVASVNLKRRDLTECQRAAIIAELAALPMGTNQHRKEGVSIDTPSAPTLEKAAKIAGVGRATVARAKAIKKADPVLAEEVKAGTTTVNFAYKQVKGTTERKAVKVPAAATAAPDTASFTLATWCKEQLLDMPLDKRVAAFNQLMTDCKIDPDVDVVRGTVRWTVEAITKKFNQRDIEIIAKQLTEHVERRHAENREKLEKRQLSLVAAKSDAQEGAGAAIATPPATSVSPESSPAVQPPT